MDKFKPLPFTVEFNLPEKSEKEIFVEVIADHEDEDGNICIDVYETDDGNEEGKTICGVSPEGKILVADSTSAKFLVRRSLEDSKVREEIIAAQERQAERKQELVDKVIEEQKEMMGVPPDQGDFTVLDELLKFLPCKVLMQALDEEEWKNYPTGWAEQEVTKS